MATRDQYLVKLNIFKRRYIQRPELIIKGLERNQGNLNRFVDAHVPVRLENAQRLKERFVTMLIEILNRPGNELYKNRFEELQHANHTALWLIGQSNYYNTLSNYKLPKDVSPAAIAAFGKFWSQTTPTTLSTRGHKKAITIEPEEVEEDELDAIVDSMKAKVEQMKTKE